MQKLSTAHQEKVNENRTYLARLVQILLFFARQGIALRGDNESSASLNKGNFLELIDLMSNVDPVLKKQIDSMPANARYFSPKIQNSLINISAKRVKENILKDVREARMIAVLADESRDISKKEQLSICFRYVTTDLRETREDFIGFHHLYELDASALPNAISNEVHKIGIDNELIIGQCYDGASVMSGRHQGVQAKLRNIYPNALYVHCHAHRLNLVLVDTVRDVLIAREFFGLVEALYVYLSRPNAHERFVEEQKNKDYVFVNWSA